MITSEQIEQAQREGREIRFMTDGQIVFLLLGLIVGVVLAIGLGVFIILAN